MPRAWAGGRLLTLRTALLLHSVPEFYPCPAFFKCSEDINRFFVYSGSGEAGKKRPFQLKLLKPRRCEPASEQPGEAVSGAPGQAAGLGREAARPPRQRGGRTAAGTPSREAGGRVFVISPEAWGTLSSFQTHTRSDISRRTCPHLETHLGSVRSLLPSLRWAGGPSWCQGRTPVLPAGGTGQKRAPTPRQAATQQRQSRGCAEDVS